MAYTEEQHEATCLYLDRSAELHQELWNNFIHSPRAKQQWKLIHPDTMTEAILSYIHGGKTHDNLIKEMVNIALNNAIQLRFNTILAGHSPDDPLTWLLEEEIYTVQQAIDQFLDTIEDEKTGQLWISDYGIVPINRILEQLLTEQKPWQQLIMIYRILNVTHCRSDLSKFFILGGVDAIDVPLPNRLNCHGNYMLY